jgi:hypothetical protein
MSFRVPLGLAAFFPRGADHPFSIPIVVHQWGFSPLQGALYRRTRYR